MYLIVEVCVPLVFAFRVVVGSIIDTVILYILENLI